MSQGLFIAAERSGTGKTMVAAALARALMDRGHAVQCFKVGPDFIDPGYHSAVTGRASRNLDGWMMGRDACQRTFDRAGKGSNFSLVEGVMGLYDGLAGAGDEGSSAQIAKWLGLPVVLIVDGSSCSRSAGAVVLGFELFDPELNIAGVVFNKVGSPAHFEMLQAGVREKCRAEVLGYIPRSDAWQTPERHLGLVMAAEREHLQEAIAGLARRIEQTVDVAMILKIAEVGGQGSGSRDQGSGFRGQGSEVRVQGSGSRDQGSGSRGQGAENGKEPKSKITKIAVARDEAFCFCYQDNIDLLEQFGAEIVFFSPVHDSGLPEAQGLYLPGGYPELHAEALSRNAAMRQAVREFSLSGRPAYAECGGYLYLLETLAVHDGKIFPMAGVFPASGRMLPRLQRLGYIEAEALEGHPFLKQGDMIRGHEFHYSETCGMASSIARTSMVQRRKDRAVFEEGFLLRRTLAGYMHLHFASNPLFARNFVRSCAR